VDPTAPPATTSAPAATEPIPDGPIVPDDAPATSIAHPTTAATDEGNDDAALDATLATITAGKGREAAAQVYQATRSGQPAPAATAAAQTKTPAGATPSTHATQPKQPDAQAPEAGDDAAAGTTPDAPDAQPSALDLTAEQQQLLSRFKVRETSFAKLDPDERADMLANLQERHDTQARLYRDNVKMAEALREGPKPPGVPKGFVRRESPPADTDPNDPLAPLNAKWREYFGDKEDIAAPLRQALEATVNPILARAERAEAAVNQFYAHMEEVDQAEGLKSVTQDGGVNLDQRTAEGKANKQKLLATARRLIGAAQQEEGWTPYSYGWRQAISDAFPTTFKAHHHLAQRRRAAQAATESARRGADPSTNANRAKPPESEDAVLDRILTAQRGGASRQELEAIGAGRG
jgi:hypothetical protein